MKKSHLIHCAWALVAVATFAIGKRSTDAPSSAGNASANSTNDSSTTLSSRSKDSDSTAPGRRSSRRPGSASSAPDAELTFLSEAGVRQLGLDLKAAKGPLERRKVFSQILANLTVENAKLMREQILSLDDDSSEFREFHYAWGAIAGEEAVFNGSETPERDMASTLAGWAAKSPEAALAYFNGLDKDAKNSGGLKWGAIYGLVDADPNLAVRFAMDQQAAGDREATRLMDLVTRQVLKSGDPADAASWASSLPSGEMQDAAISRVAREYADDDPVATLDWAATLPEGNGKNRAVRESFSEWAQNDPQAAATRLDSMAKSPERDSATYGYATRVAWEDPQTGIEWANTITDEGTRNRAVEETGRVFYRKDPEAAKQWLSNSGLSEKQQADITRRRGRG
ncbi:MAG: hypothetical protein ACJAVK_000219 [Akkermansiaceae bacterium]|jgi:hypothetical protein